MSNVVKVKRGVDIKLVGEAEKVLSPEKLPIETIAIKPPDFHGARFKLSVKEGDEVKAGTPLLYNKDNENVKFCSTVSGEVAQIVRGAKRRLMEIRILADGEVKYEDFGSADPNALSRDEIIEKMAASGCWPFFKERPFNVVANPDVIPRDIFISGFDSAPLAADLAFILDGEDEAMQVGIDAIRKLTSGSVQLGVSAKKTAGKALSGLKGVKVTQYDGPHPAGLVGVHIHNIAPINQGETVWTISPEHVVIIGRLFMTGKFDARIKIAVTGSEAINRQYHETIIGAPVKHFVEGNMTDKNNRIISGNVLTGANVGVDGYMSFYERQITVIPEGDEPELFGWVIPKTDKFSISRTLPAWLMPNKKFELDTNLHGEPRAFVVSGQYDKVFPFDILPVFLLKAIITNDIEAMENLGLYEVVEEDFALCEVVCTSKTPVQKIVREGLDLMKQELG